ncbi:MAG: transcription termination factor Rho [Planctomycetaceae bacterium]|nr:transcription termination factor Rho [Planctomycetaceae bacterium]
MATKSTSSSKTKSDSKSTPRRTSRKKAVVADEGVDTVTKSESSGDDDFGAGLDDDGSQERPAAKPKPKRTRRTKKAAPAAVSAEPSSPAEVTKPVDDFGADLDDAPARPSERPAESVSDDQPSSSASEERPAGESPTEGNESGGRRRRRRKRGGRRDGDAPQGQGQGQGNAPQGQRRQDNNSGGGRGNKNRRRDSRDGRDNRDKGGQRGGGGPRRLTKFEQNAAPALPAVTSGTVEGVLELHPKGYGFLRSAANDYGAQETDPFVSSSFVEKHLLREGVLIRGEIGPGTRGQGPRLLEIESIDGRTPEEFEKIKHFDHLTPINPHEQIRLETGPTPLTMRVMDILTPIGKGQRALLVAPPRSGKTMLLQDIAEAVSKNHPEIHLIVLLIDERPEEVTEMRRNVHGDVIASSMDRDVESHVRISQLVIERGKRIAESGKDCFILMDSVTRCARAFNKWIGGGRESKIGTGGLDVRAMEIPRKMFGTARLFDEGGSLTVCATALIDTGSRMDEAIFQEFKGTGNMELVLSRDLADRRIWPAIDITRSGTRREEKILDPEQLDGITMLRRSLVSMSPVEAMDQLTRTMAKFPSNAEFLQKIRNVL